MKKTGNHAHFIHFGLIMMLLIGFAQADWQTVYTSTGYELKSVCFPVNSQTGYVVGFGGTSNRILKTTNAGLNWTIQDAGVTAGLMDVFFRASNDLGYAVGFDGTILKTTNGGTEWLPQNSGVSYDLNAIQFPVDDDTGYCVGFNGVILKTTNAGTDWIQLNTGVTDWLTGVDFPNDCQTGYAVGHMCALKTTNAGVDWVDITDPNMYMGLESVVFPLSDRIGYTCGYDMFIFKTTDGGATWDSTRPFAATDEYAAVHTLDFPVDDHVGYAGGTGFNIFKTTDAGESWFEQPVPWGIVYSICFPNGNDTGYAACTETHILKTTDGGHSVAETEQSSICRLTIQPNPVRFMARISGQENTEFYIFDASGRKVAICHGDQIGKDLKPGVYFVKAAKSADQLIKFIKLR